MLSSTTGGSKSTVVGSYKSAQATKQRHTPEPKLTNRRSHNKVMYKRRTSSIPRPTYTKLNILSALHTLITVSKRNRNDLQDLSQERAPTDSPQLQRTIKGRPFTGIDTPRRIPVSLKLARTLRSEDGPTVTESYRSSPITSKPRRHSNNSYYLRLRINPYHPDNAPN